MKNIQLINSIESFLNNVLHHLNPVEVGELISLNASVNYVGNTSLIVGIRVESLNLISGKVNHTNSCFFTMAAKDANGNLTKVPGLLIESELQLRRFCEGMELKKLSKQKRAMLKSDLNGFSVNQLKDICCEENCEVEIN